MATSHDDRRRMILTVDPAANYLLGLPLLLVPHGAAKVLGLPDEKSSFYQRALGGVLTGVATAPHVERLPRRGRAMLWAVASEVLGLAGVEAWQEWRFRLVG